MNSKIITLASALTVGVAGTGESSADSFCKPEQEGDLCTKIMKLKNDEGISYSEALDRILKTPEIVDQYSYCPTNTPS